MYNPTNQGIITIPNKYFRDMVNHAYEDDINEQCGLLSGFQYQNHFVVHDFKPIRNELKGSSDRFIMNPEQQMDYTNKVNALSVKYSNDPETSNGQFGVIACFHTHPFWSGDPSGIDKAAAINIGEDWIWLIFGLKDHILRAWNWNQEKKSFSRMGITNV